MPRQIKNDKNPYTLKNCFGFDENEIDLWNKSTSPNDTITFEFQENKPYRLALYVRPNERRRLQKTNASLLMRSMLEKQSKNKKNESTISQKAKKMEESKSKRKDTKTGNIMLFDENTKPENISAKRSKKASDRVTFDKEDTIMEIPSNRKNILKEVNTKPVTKTKQNKIRRSYERKCKESETEKIVEPPSAEILKELDVKKLTRTKPKKNAKEDKEFETWANNMNSAFDDIEKFELSVTYD